MNIKTKIAYDCNNKLLLGIGRSEGKEPYRLFNG